MREAAGIGQKELARELGYHSSGDVSHHEARLRHNRFTVQRFLTAIEELKTRKSGNRLSRQQRERERQVQLAQLVRAAEKLSRDAQKLLVTR
ncbi:MAG: hypothetical protein ACHQ0J_05005 [Candidatus Dormibacterales bacterium]